MKLRLHKAIAEAGIASRRAAEELIRQGRVSVNGEIVTGMGVQVDPEIDTVTVDGKPMSKGLKKRTYMIYKPVGVLCTRNDPQGRPTVYDLLPPEVSEGLHSAGRLDLDAEGMLILTNDGELSQALTHPSGHHHKTYLVALKGEMDRPALRKMRNGIELDDGLTLPASVDVVRTMSNARETTVTLVLREGRKNQIKRMGDAVGHRIISIKRMATGRLELPPKMKPGTYKKLTVKEIKTLSGGGGVTAGRRAQGAGRSKTSSESRSQSPKAKPGPSDGETGGVSGRPSAKLGTGWAKGSQSPKGKPRRGDAETPGGTAGRRAEGAGRSKTSPESRVQSPKAKRRGIDQQHPSSRKKP